MLTTNMTLLLTIDVTRTTANQKKKTIGKLQENCTRWRNIVKKETGSYFQKFQTIRIKPK